MAILDGELTMKYLPGDRIRLALCAENPDFPDITIPELSEFTVSGSGHLGAIPRGLERGFQPALLAQRRSCCACR